MTQKRLKFRGDPIIRQIVSRLHVDTPDEEVLAYAHSRLKKEAWEELSAANKHAFDREALRVHRANQELYYGVLRMPKPTLSDWEPPATALSEWNHFLFMLNRDMHLRGLAGGRVFVDLNSAIEYTTQIVMKAGLAVRLDAPCQFTRRHGQCRFALGMQSKTGTETIRRHKLLVAWDVVHDDGATVAYAQIT